MSKRTRQFCPQLRTILEAWLPQIGTPDGADPWLFPGARKRRPWDQTSCGYRPLDRLAEAGQAVGIAGLTFQSLRHSWATHAESEWQLGDALIQRCLRHTNPMTSRRYRHADLVNLAKSVREVRYQPSPLPRMPGQGMAGPHFATVTVSTADSSVLT